MPSIDYSHPMTDDEIKHKWHLLHKNPELREKEFRPEILASWERSSQYNVPRYARENVNICTASEFKIALEKSDFLVNNALPVMEGLLDFVTGTGFGVNLIDSNGVSLISIADNDYEQWEKSVKLSRGLIWTENLMGTNAAPLSMHLARPVSVYAHEHYCLYNIVSAESYCPIFDDGHVIGSIGMVGRHERFNKHTLGMVVAAAKHIESKMMLNRVSKYQQVLMESMSDGVVAVDISGTITYINKHFLKILGLGNTNIIGSNIYDMLGNNEDNQYFINLVKSRNTVTDELVVMTIGENNIRCYVTCTPLMNNSPYGVGSVIIVRDGERVRNMVGKWIGRSAKMTFDDVVGENPKFKDVIRMAKSAPNSHSNILLLGESGTGKDVIAQAMHNNSIRKNGPFVAINCAALPHELIASELFGYEYGAFTGAKKGGNIGKFELADQGTIFLDEIGDIPMDIQVVLLRVLEEKSIIRLGGSKLIPVNVRVIAATNKNLDEEIARNRFRRDLYYRLGVIKLHLPPLRERPDDIPRLADHFLQNLSQRFNEPIKRLSPGAIKVLVSYPWPGNIRELQNVLEGATQLATDNELTSDYVKNYLNLQNQPKRPFQNSFKALSDYDPSVTVSDVERQMIEEYLMVGYEKNEIAQALGISRRTLYRRLHEYGFL